MKIKRLHPDAILPYYATDGASAFDIFAYKWALTHLTICQVNKC